MGRSEEHSIPMQVKIIGMHCEQHIVEIGTVKRTNIVPSVPSANIIDAVFSITNFVNGQLHRHHWQTAAPVF